MTNKLYKSTLFLSILVLAFSLQVQAQQGADEQRSLLPDIDPQDIEIRSEFKANFRGLTRQPILGFRPEDRVHRVDPDRMPFIESEEQRMAQLPVVELSRPDPPEMELFSYPSAQNLYSEIGYGNYRSPRLNLFAGTEVGSESHLTTRLRHHSSAGHLAGNFGAFRNFYGDAGYYATPGKGRLNVHIGGESNFNNLYPVFFPATGSSNLRNEYDGAHLNASYQQFANNYEGWEVKGAYNLFEARSRIYSSSAETREHVGELQAGYQWTGERLHELFRVDIMGEKGKFSGDPSYEGWYRVGADITYERLLAHTALLTGTLGLHGAEEPNGGQLLLPTSNITAKYWIGNDLTLQANFETSLSGQSLKTRYGDNPFILAHRPQFAYSYQIGGSVKTEYQPFDRLLFTGKGSYHHIRDYAFMARGDRVRSLFIDMVNNSGRNSAVINYYKTFYEKVRIAELDFSITFDLIPQTFWFDLEGSIRNHKLTESSKPVPYVSDYNIKSSVFAKPIDSFRINLWGEYVGPRATSDDNNELLSYFSVGSRFEFRVDNRIGLYIEGKNILDQQYQVWDGYPARPLQLYGGVTVNL